MDNSGQSVARCVHKGSRDIEELQGGVPIATTRPDRVGDAKQPDKDAERVAPQLGVQQSHRKSPINGG